MIRSLARTFPALATFTRYFGVQAGGLCLDLGLAWLAVRSGAPDAAAVAAGIVPSTLATFAAHESWTFGTRAPEGRLRRFGGYAGLGFVAFLVRSLSLIPLAALLPGTGWEALSRLVAATGASFAVGYVLARWLVFRPDGDALAGAPRPVDRPGPTALP